MKWLALCMAACAAFTLAACDGGRSAADDGELHVYAGIPPVAYLADRIGGEHARVGVLVSGNQDPHTFDPSPRQVVELERADVYMSVGLPFERSVIKTVRGNNPDITVLNLAKATGEHGHDDGAHGEEDGHHEHDAHDEHAHHEHEEEHGHEGDAHDEHGHEGHEEEHAEHHEEEEHEAHEGHDHGHAHHHHGGPDPHVWLSPPRLRAMAQELTEVLSEKAPEHAEDFVRNRDAFLAELDEVDERIGHQLEPFRGRRFYVYHPAFGHFGEAYGLEQRSVEVGGKAPTMRQVDNLVHEAREDGVRVIFVQPQFSPRMAQSAAQELGGAVVPIDPLRRNVLESLRTIADRLEEAFDETRTQESP